MRDYPHTVLLSRLRSNRVLYRLPSPSSSKGHPRWYGEKFDLRAPKTWGEAQRQETLSLTTARGKRFEVELEFWPDLLMRGAQDCPMHQYPFDVVRVCRRDEKGQAVFLPMWLMVFGQKRRQLSLHDIFSAYRQRFSLEHFFRFAKQRLLLTALQLLKLLMSKTGSGYLCGLQSTLGRSSFGPIYASSLAAIFTLIFSSDCFPSSSSTRFYSHYSAVRHFYPSSQTSRFLSWSSFWSFSDPSSLPSSC